jgi:hypothetical protein
LEAIGEFLIGELEAFDLTVFSIAGVGSRLAGPDAGVFKIMGLVGRIEGGRGFPSISGPGRPVGNERFSLDSARLRRVAFARRRWPSTVTAVAVANGGTSR